MGNERAEMLVELIGGPLDGARVVCQKDQMIYRSHVAFIGLASPVIATSAKPSKQGFRCTSEVLYRNTGTMGSWAAGFTEPVHLFEWVGWLQGKETHERTTEG